jgi:hypothetical protein
MKYRKTALGKQLFQERNITLSFRQRSAFILFDGEKDDSVIFKALAATGLDAADIAHLVEAGLIEVSDGFKSSDFRSSDFRASMPFGASVPPITANTAAPSASAGPIASAAAPPLAASEQERYQRAYPIATKLTSGLGLRGFRLNFALESAAGYKELVALAPKIREAVGDEKFAELARALKGL